MDFLDVLIRALGLQDVDIESCDYDTENLTANFTVRQRRERATCHCCGEPLYGVKQWRRRKLKGPRLGTFLNVEVTLYQLQGACNYCQKHRLGFAPYIHPRFKNMLCSFAESAGGG